MKPLLLIAVGVSLVVVAWILPGMVGGRQAWTDEMAASYQDVSIKFHNAQHQHAAGHTEATEPEGGPSLEEARAAYLIQRAELQAAQDRGKGTARVLWWIGMGCSMLGCILHYKHEQK